ncbi:MAG: hypothetical protein M1837_007450 [Sclerophora amabilis]|nr:MAG: hypothetical protein M1837_007450 [Sclerophora amabilis]
MAGASTPRSDDNTSSLGDSHYDHITESDLQTSDDEDLDDTGVSVSTRGLDDMSSISDFNETRSASSQADPQESYASEDLIAPFGDHEINESGMTVTDEKEDSSPSTPDSSIEFEEPPCGTDQVAAIHTIRNFDAQQTRDILARLRIDDPPARLAATVRQTMSRERLALEEPFRILYIGNRFAKDRIVDKIARSLAVPLLDDSKEPTARVQSSRFNVMPVSDFGSDKPPEVTLVPSVGVDLVVDECTAAKTSKQDKRPDSLGLRLNDSIWYSSIHKDNKFGLEPREHWQLPHVAIFFCSDSDSMETRQTRLYARSFMARHAVPSIIVSESPLFERLTEHFALDTHSIHMCLESRSPGDRGNLVYKRLPIDLSTFLNIDARQMNRNLACLTGLHPGRDSKGLFGQGRPTMSRARTVSSDGDVEKLPSHYYGLSQSVSFLGERTRHEWRALALLASVLMIGVLGTTFALVFHQPQYPMQTFPVRQIRHQGPMSTSSISASLSTSQSSSLMTPSDTLQAKPSPASTDRDPKSLMVAMTGTDYSYGGGDGSSNILNESDEFKLQILGCCHVILKPPRRHTILKKAPQLFVEIHRLDQPIEARLGKLFDGVYELGLKQEDAYGALNVTVSTRSKPLLNQTFLLDFGTSWLNLASLKGRVAMASNRLQKDLQVFQSRLQNTLGEVNLDIRVFANHTKRVALETTQEAKRLRDLSLRQTQGPRSMIASKAKDLSYQVSRNGLALSKEIVLRSHTVSTAVYRRAARLYETTSFAEPLRQLPDLSHLRNSETFTLLKYQRQACQIWQKLIGTQMRAVDFSFTRVGKETSCWGSKSCKKQRK